MKVSFGKPLTTSNVLELVDSYTIFKTYSDDFTTIGKMFKSDFRKDINPSCCVIFHGGDLLYTDFGDPPNEYSRKGSYRAINFIARKYGLTYYNALLKVALDFKLNLSYMTLNNHQVCSYTIPKKKIDLKRYKEKSDTIIKVKRIPFTEDDLKYWASYYWSLDMLNKAKISRISHFWLHNDKHDNICFDVTNQIVYNYDYYWNKGVFRRKLYFPFKSDNRFISNIDDTVVQGWDLLPKKGGDILFITKAFKDIGVFMKLGYYAIAPNNEKTFIPEKVLTKLKTKWKHIIIWFDNDKTGIESSEYFSGLYNLPSFCTPLDCKYKDPSDYAKELGIESFKFLLNNKLDASIYKR